MLPTAYATAIGKASATYGILPPCQRMKDTSNSEWPSWNPRPLIVYLVLIITLIASAPVSALLVQGGHSTLPLSIQCISPANKQTSYQDNNERLLYSMFLTSLSAVDEEEDTPANMVDPINVQTLKLEYDEVVRVLDPNTVKLKRNGLVTFAYVQTPSGYNSNFQFPECMNKSPSSKARQLLPKGSKVGVRFLDDKKKNTGNTRPRAAFLITKDGTIVNTELVRSGFARPLARGREASGLTNQLASLQQEAKDKGLGTYMKCDQQQSETFIATDDQFEPLDYTVQTQWGDDGGKPILQKRQDTAKRPANPGDIKGCSDFDYYEDALQWYETYAPWYGDVAKLDRDGDGVPCNGLPHTKNQSRYRMKVPSLQRGP